MPAFGFSATDFLVAIELIAKVSKALKDVGGASSDYQQVIIELEGLKNALRHLETLKPSEDNVNHVNAIRGMALACQLPLRDFLARLQQYEPTMGPLARRRPLIGAGRKVCWTLFVAEEVTKLRAFLAAKVMSINLLLATHASETLSSINSQTHKHYNALESAISKHRAILDEHKDELAKIKEEVTQSRTLLAHDISQRTTATQALGGDVASLRQDVQCSNRQLETLSNATTSLQSSVVSLASIGRQVLSSIRSFPTEIRGLLQGIMQSNLQIYGLLLSMQGNIPGSPTLLLQTNIHFEDALGRVRQLPYEWFHHWEPFKGLLLAEFKDLPGENSVLNGHFHIVDLKRSSRLINEENWSQSIFPGSAISMSVIISQLRMQVGMCPRESCKAKQAASDSSLAMVVCPSCGLRYFRGSLLGEGFGNISAIEEDQEVSRRQINQDLKQFGSRVLPSEVKDMEDTSIEPAPVKEAFTSCKRTAHETLSEHIKQRSGAQKGFASSSLPSIASPLSSKTESTPSPFGIDWSQGETPLDAWLNQSAIPASGIANSVGDIETEIQEKEVREREIREIESFRNVHISHAVRSGADASGREYASPKDIQELGASGLIYYRNILDGYPDAPDYLARRLAKANCRRAARLQSAWNRDELVTTESDPKRPRHEPDTLDPLGLPTLPSLQFKVPQHLPTKDICEGSSTVASSQSLEHHDSEQWSSEAVSDSDESQRDRALLDFKILVSRMYDSIEIARSICQTTESTPTDPVSQLVSQPGQSLTPEFDSWKHGLQPRAAKLVAGLHAWIMDARVALTSAMARPFDGYSLYQSPVPQRCGDSVPSTNHPQQDLFGIRLTELIGNINMSIEETWSLQKELPPENKESESQGSSEGYRSSLDRALRPKLRSLATQLNTTKRRLQVICSLITNQSPNFPGLPISENQLCHLPSSASQEAKEKSRADFWSAGTQSTLPSSSASGYSSRNDSLRGRSKYDSEEQNPVFSARRSTGSLARSSPKSIELNPVLSLPRPPVERRDDQSSESQSIILPLKFECDICGKSIEVQRRRDWKKHVFRDLQPYVCTFEHCTQPDEMYCTRRELIKHEFTNHREQHTYVWKCTLTGCRAEFTCLSDCKTHVASHVSASNSIKIAPWEIHDVVCPLCKEVIEPGRLMLGRHLGRHMEEISFAVLTKPDEQWKFYDDTASGFSWEF